MTALLDCNRVTLAAGPKQLVRSLEWTVGAGEQWGILGPNGCGKTTLLHSLSGLHEVREGEILLRGQPLGALSRREIARLTGLLFQENHYPFPLSVEELVLAGRFPWQSVLAVVSAEERRLAREALATMQLEGFQQRRIDSLSGGERRRVALAALLCQQAAINLLDEPENHLDPGIRLTLLRRFLEQQPAARATVMVMHDPALAVRLCSHLLLLFSDGSWLAGRTEEIATGGNLSRLYGAPFEATRAGEVLLVYPG